MLVAWSPILRLDRKMRWKGKQIVVGGVTRLFDGEGRGKHSVWEFLEVYGPLQRQHRLPKCTEPDQLLLVQNLYVWFGVYLRRAYHFPGTEGKISALDKEVFECICKVSRAQEFDYIKPDDLTKSTPKPETARRAKRNRPKSILEHLKGFTVCPVYAWSTGTAELTTATAPPNSLFPSHRSFLGQRRGTAIGTFIRYPISAVHFVPSVSFLDQIDKDFLKYRWIGPRLLDREGSFGSCLAAIDEPCEYQKEVNVYINLNQDDSAGDIGWIREADKDSIFEAINTAHAPTGAYWYWCSH
ncbi:hypothetical protein K440DRAFT_642800 [Wilcoxina mikolae CBS 423.85]|nr:hypothetical protein K440DRAFT_642800 [Wilcoxina mikolae CBS 423.85]